jgi:hypothetical protein
MTTPQPAPVPPNAAARAYVPTRRTDHPPVIRCTCTPGAAAIEACPVPHNIWLNPDHARR